MKLEYIKNERTVFVWLTGDGLKLTGSYNIDDDKVGFVNMVRAIERNDLETVRTLVTLKFNMIDAINTFGKGKVAFQDGVLYYLSGDKLNPIDTVLTRRIREMIAAGSNPDILVKFLENLVQNPDPRAVNDFYDFLMINNLAMTEDGHFIAYKIVRHDFMDLYTGKMPNRPGTTVKIGRENVDPDPNRTCSHGLHVCSKDYLPQYGGFYGSGDTRNKILAVKVNPRDVCAFPKDYRNAKARVAQYDVIGEFKLTDRNFLKEQIALLEAGVTVNTALIKKILSTVE
jgi:hypothetical protein